MCACMPFYSGLLCAPAILPFHTVAGSVHDGVLVHLPKAAHLPRRLPSQRPARLLAQAAASLPRSLQRALMRSST
jgi:hypothetical protein